MLLHIYVGLTTRARWTLNMRMIWWHSISWKTCCCWSMMWKIFIKGMDMGMGRWRRNEWRVRGEEWRVRGEEWGVRGEGWGVRGEEWGVRGEEWGVKSKEFSRGVAPQWPINVVHFFQLALLNSLVLYQSFVVSFCSNKQLTYWLLSSYKDYLNYTLILLYVLGTTIV